MPQERVYGLKQEIATIQTEGEVTPPDTVTNDVSVYWTKKTPNSPNDGPEGSVFVGLLDQCAARPDRLGWAELDRSAINRLIGFLRTARDGAFGKDA